MRTRSFLRQATWLLLVSVVVFGLGVTGSASAAWAGDKAPPPVPAGSAYHAERVG